MMLFIVIVFVWPWYAENIWLFGVLLLVSVIVPGHYVYKHALRKHPCSIRQIRIHRDNIRITRRNGRVQFARLSCIAIGDQWLVVKIRDSRERVIIDAESAGMASYCRLRSRAIAANQGR